MIEEPEQLVRRAQGGDTLAMNDLLDQLTPYVGRICGPIALSNGPDATQEALVAVFRSLRTLKEPGALFGWVRAIAVREAIRVARQDQRQVAADLDELPAPNDPQLLVDVRDTLARLTPEHRALLVLRDIEGLDEQAAAVLLELPAGTAKSRLHRARASFRKAWGS
ncbi:RNA polymerase sigma-70 factor (ECF subfamily) [Kribbella orskensis]|uniref:RNA polymerase sigma-70 factor (ECF subfamily) n=1 Tax=Kribbella orskensis TaxID=2512216 RepID=A0ABY2BAA0_9ACTN|nr:MULTISPECIES: RNA polymerase sigma factor [Kribbella]TCN32257.1 RNA polymerase sigma-70 factor (ECF subfamily) [Kribbella sp. VKM Ac-2500]TCO12648.1 RNA polymerase sigma-70 factor (ECF subfamily) [Kribbella orskensis]